MAWQRWHVAPGPLLSSPRTCWLIWSGGAPTTILCALTNRCGRGSCSHESEVAIVWRNVTGNGHQPWQREEPPDAGRRARCSLAPYQRFPLEEYRSQMRMASYAARKSGKATAKALEWSLASGRGGLTGLLKDQIPARSWFGEG